MSLLFDFARPPFDCLGEAARERLGQRLSICYFRAGQTVLHPGDEPPGLYLVIKGAVEESAPHQPFGDYGVGDMFDVRAQFDGHCRHVSPPWKIPSASSFPAPSFWPCATSTPISPATSPPPWRSASGSRSAAASSDSRTWQSSS